ncbi:TonB-dependent receptor [bacterium]|nr:TonB-dependent receptor [bacterium]
MIQKKAAQFGLVLAGCSLGMAQDELPPLIVTATRFAAPVSDTTSSVTVFTAAELDRIQQTRLTDTLALVPGVQGLSTAGYTGNIGTVIVRGLRTSYVQTVVDGVRITDSTNGLNNFLGAGHLGNISSLEVLRGPQSVLYGSGAAGGVIGYDTTVGEGESSYEILGEAGSYGHYRTSFSAQGQVGDLAYSVGAGFFRADNETFAALSRHDYEQYFETLALEWTVREDLRIKLSYRGSQNELDTTTDFGFGPSDAAIETDLNLVALNAIYDVNPGWTTRLTLGYYDESYDADFSGFPVTSDYDRFTVNWNNRIELSDDFDLIAGLEYSDSSYRNSAGRDLDYETLGVYAKATWQATDELLVDGGVRYEDHNFFGGDTAWDLGAAYSFDHTGTRLKARVSEAFRTPRLLDSEAFNPGFGASQRANPNLKTEEILGFEIGVEQDFGGHLLEVTFFQQDLDNAIARGPSSTVGGVTSYENINLPGTSQVSGFEMGLSGAIFQDEVRYRIAWTEQNKEEVLDVPDRQIDVDLSYATDFWSAGIGLSYVEGASYGLANAVDDRVLTRIYGSYQVTDALSVYGRVENLFSQDYFVSDDGFLPIEGQARSFVLGAKFEW